MKHLKVYWWNDANDEILTECDCTISLNFEIYFLKFPWAATHIFSFKKMLKGLLSALKGLRHDSLSYYDHRKNFLLNSLQR